jgi:phage terminase large subunit-like protein
VKAKDYAAIATQYARDVVDGRILACKWVRLAAARHLTDLQRAAEGWRYTWNPELETQEGKQYRPADRACLFIELLPHIKGDWASRSERIRLEPWQVFVVASIFGWVDRDTQRRRFRIADLFVPRKNAKSTIAAGIGLYMAFVDGEFGAEVYSGATSEDQAGEVFSPAKLMASRSPDFLTRFGVTVRASNISAPETNSKFEPVIGKPGDGASPSCAIVDEYHEHPTEDLYDTMITGMGARSQPLMLVITTAGDDISGPCYAHQVELQQILEGVIDDERRFGVIYTVDDTDDWTTTEALIKANPNFGVSIDTEFLEVQQRDAIRDPRKQATFQTKHLNIWVASASPWLNLHDWKAAADKTLREEDFAGEELWEGLDLANTTDIASKCKAFKRMVPENALLDSEGKEVTDALRKLARDTYGERLPPGWRWGKVLREHYYFFWRHYLPEEIIEQPEHKHYKGWHREGWITATSGSMIDHDKIKTDVDADAELHVIKEVALDRWGAAGISAALELNGYTVVAVPMNVSHLSAPMKWIDGLLKSRRLHHNGDPVATWAVSNVEVKPDHNDNWFPRKQNRAKKTDPAVAMIIAVSRAMVAQPEEGIDAWLKAPAAA